MKGCLWIEASLRVLLVILALGSEVRGADLAPNANAVLEATTSAASQGLYFAKKEYQPRPLPRYEPTRDKLPAPISDENPDWVRMYWKAWELAFRNFHEPAPGSGYVSQFIDAAFNDNAFLWDTAFMTMFCNYAHGLVPGIESLDNFYARQHEDGEICREINRRTGQDYADWRNLEQKPLFSRSGWNVAQPGLPSDRNTAVEYRGRTVPQPAPVLTLDGLNHPILAWAELESLRVTGDRERIAAVYPPLVRYHAALEKYLRQGNGLYMTDWASMDNSPRNPFLRGGGCAVDTSSQMVLFARNLANMAELLGKTGEATRWKREADALARLVNQLMWDPDRRFYFDLTLDGSRAPVKTVAAFWTLIAGVARPEHARALIAHLNDPKTFKRTHRIPTLAADEPGYDPQGGYWRGAVWAPTTTMVVRGLEEYGHRELAAEVALNHLDLMNRVFQETGTIWENYAPDAALPGRPGKKDFVGWSGLGPILFLIEYGIGLKPDAARNELAWEVRSAQRVGCERYRFNGHLVSLILEPLARDAPQRKLSVESDGPFTLVLQRSGHRTTYTVTRGRREFLWPGE